MNLLTLCDFDGVLYDASEIKRNWNRYLIERGVDVFYDVYAEVKEAKGYFEPETLYFLMSNRRPGWGVMTRYMIERYPYENHIFSHAANALQLLRSIGRVVVWSQGEESFQNRKIEACALHVDGTFISLTKVNDSERLLKEWAGFDELAVIDDKLDNLIGMPDYAIKIRIGDSSIYPSFKTAIEAAEYLYKISKKCVKL